MRKKLYWWAIASSEYVPELIHGTDKDETSKVADELMANATKEDNIKRVKFYCGRHTSSAPALKRATLLWSGWKFAEAEAKMAKLAEAKQADAVEGAGGGG